MAFHAHDLSASPRKRSGSSLLGQMRREGYTPAVYYGKKAENVNLKVETRVLLELLKQTVSDNILVNLKVEGEEDRLALIHEVQHEPLSGEILHVDFLAVTRGETMHARVPLVLVGTAQGVKSGGVLSSQVDELAIACRPSQLPEQIDVDVSALEVGDAIYVADLVLPEGVETEVESTVVIARVAPPILSSDEEAADGDAAAEPELIGKKPAEEAAE